MARSRTPGFGTGTASIGARALLTVVASLLSGLLAGCSGMVDTATGTTHDAVSLQGNVHGGQQPVTGATIQLYAAQATGYGAASAPLISKSILSDSTGSFRIDNDYTCPDAPNDQVYLVATGGNPGAGNNGNLVLVAALGACSNLSSSTFVVINEVSTVAAAYSLSGFMSDYQHVATSSTNYLGLQHAFATVSNLMDVAVGIPNTVTPAYQTAPAGTSAKTFASVVPNAEIDTLANIIASCVNTNGVGGSSTACSSLFAAAKPPAGATPTDTTQAALDIALNPGNNVTTLFNLSAASVPFNPTLAAAPNDWTIALNFIGGGLGGSAASSDSSSQDLAIDGSGDLWIVNQRRSSITELDNLGAPISASTVLTPSLVNGGFKGGGLVSPNSIAIDTLGNAWVVSGAGLLSEFTSAGVPVGSGFMGGGLDDGANGSDDASAIAIDGTNQIFVGYSSGIAAFSNSGNPLSASPYTADIELPVSLSIDDGGNIFAANSGNGMVTKMSNGGNLLDVSQNVLPAAEPFSALDSKGQLWVPIGLPDSAIYQFTSSAMLNMAYNGYSSILGPVGIAIDGAGNIWSTNFGGSCGTNCTVPPNVTEMAANGSLLSPAGTGYTGTGTNLLSEPRAIRADASGNLWVLNSPNQSTVTEFVGLAKPTITPLAQAVKSDAIGTLP